MDLLQITGTQYILETFFSVAFWVGFWVGDGCLKGFEKLGREGLLAVLALLGSISWTATVLSFVFQPCTSAFIFFALASIINLILLIRWPISNDH